jgi:hypothetical protein
MTRYGELKKLDPWPGDGVRKNGDETVTGRRRVGHGHGKETFASLYDHGWNVNIKDDYKNDLFKKKFKID